MVRVRRAGNALLDAATDAVRCVDHCRRLVGSVQLGKAASVGEQRPQVRSGSKLGSGEFGVRTPATQGMVHVGQQRVFPCQPRTQPQQRAAQLLVGYDIRAVIQRPDAQRILLHRRYVPGPLKLPRAGNRRLREQRQHQRLGRQEQPDGPTPFRRGRGRAIHRNSLLVPHPSLDLREDALPSAWAKTTLNSSSYCSSHWSDSRRKRCSVVCRCLSKITVRAP